MDRDQWERTASGLQEFADAGKIQTDLQRYLFASFSQSSFRKFFVRIWLQVSDIGDAKAFEAIKPNAISDQCNKKEPRTDP